MTAGGEGGRPRPGPRPREPAIRAPLAALALAALILAAYGVQSLASDPQAVADRLGFAAADPWRDGGAELLTSLFVHAGWGHAALNAAAALAFASPVSRRLGEGPRGTLVLCALYAASGALGSLAFALMAPQALLIGASGAVAGLMGAASRIGLARGARLLPLADRSVLGMAAAWVILNLAIGVAGLDIGTGGAPVAWQAHLAGYAAGLLLIGPALRAAGRPH